MERKLTNGEYKERLIILKQLIDEGCNLKTISEKINLPVTTVKSIIYSHDWHIHKTRKNCFTCDNFYINHKGLPCCKIGQCGMMVKHKPRINDDYELEQPCDIVGRYFGISMSNEEAEKFINNCKIFYENEFC